jgi:hypothetical protein
MWRWLFAALALAALLWWLASRDGPGVGQASVDGGGAVVCTLPPAFAGDENPRQSGDDGMAAFRLGDADVTPLHGFSLRARVLSRKDYSHGTEADYSPTDLALGWGPMAAEGMAERLGVTQNGRWYRYRWGSEGPPLPPAQIARNSANMHLIPADDEVADALDGVRVGHTVELHGWLVRIERDDGWKWKSSTRRDDTGDGSCELVYVCAIAAR